MPGFLEAMSDNIRIDKEKCIFCAKCVDTCILDNLRMKLAPCRAACPMGVNVQGYVQLIKRGENERARQLIRETLPFPETMCMVCHHPCESECERGKTDAPVSIRGLKRYLFDSEAGQVSQKPELAKATGQTVAVIGAGPAGLVAAYDLALQGHTVTIYEAGGAAGGQLRHGIPSFRLPADLVERELAVLPRMGVTFVFNCVVGKDISLKDIMAKHTAVVLAVGLDSSKALGIEGEKLAGVLDGIAFLADARTAKLGTMKGEVLIIGGGNVALDTAMVAKRQGASKVTIVSLECKNDLPAFAEEVAQAEQEGIVFESSWGPVRFLEKDKKVCGVEVKKCTSVFDADKHFAPCFDDSCNKTLQADIVIIAIGQDRTGLILKDSALTPADLDASNPVTRQCKNLPVFVAGDVLTGASSVVDAMAGGREAAISAHRLLAGDDLIYNRRYKGPFETDFDIDSSKACATPRQEAPQHQCKGAGDYALIEQTLKKDAAFAESERCLSCGGPFGKFRSCWFCLPCEVECPEKALYVEIPYLLR